MIHEKANDDLYQVYKFVCLFVSNWTSVMKAFSFDRLLSETCIDAVTSIYYKYYIMVTRISNR